MSDAKLKVGFMDIVGYIKYVPSLVGVVMGAVAMVEAVMVGDPGTAKKAAVLASISGMWGQISAEYGIAGDFSKFVPILSLLIDLAVAIYNIFWKAPVVPVV
jgi:hypothetical protein